MPQPLLSAASARKRAFVPLCPRFATPQQAAEAAAGMNGFQLDGRRLRCAVEGSSASAEGAGALPRAKSASDIPLPPRALDRAHAVEALAAKMRAVLQDRGELHGTSPQARAAAGAAGAAAASGGTPTAAHGAAAGAFSGRPPGVSPGQGGPAHYPQHHQWVPPGHMQVGVRLWLCWQAVKGTPHGRWCLRHTCTFVPMCP